MMEYFFVLYQCTTGRGVEVYTPRKSRGPMVGRCERKFTRYVWQYAILQKDPLVLSGIVYGNNNYRMSSDEYDATPMPHTYGFAPRPDVVFDGRSTQSGMGRWANDCLRPNRQAGHCVENNLKPA
jgi:hypothetical protein